MNEREKYQKITEIYKSIVEFSTNLNRYKNGTYIKNFIVNNDIVPLTKIFEALTIEKALIGDDFHKIFWDICQLLIRLTNEKDEDNIKYLSDSYLHYCNEYNEKMQNIFFTPKYKGDSIIMKEKILFLTSNPSDTSRLRIDKEARDIEEGLRRANKRDSFDFEVKLATRPRDLSRAILDENPQILHISGHGELEGILLEDENGTSKIVTTEALSELFSLFGDTIRCVILNSCYSESQAKEISKHIPFVIGMSKAVPDNTAIAFATSFYDAIGAGREIEFAFKFAITNIGLEGLTGNQIPVLLKKGNTTPQ